MWNPLHFAAYHGHLEVVKYLKEDIKINIGQTAPKNFAMNEGEQVNDQEAFIEDIVFVLQMSLVKENNEIFSYLLQHYSQYWPKNLFDDWFKEVLFKHFSFFSQDHILQVIRIFFSSKTCRSIYGGLVAKKQKEWIIELVNQIESSFSLDNEKEKSIRTVALQQLTNQPYCG